MPGGFSDTEQIVGVLDGIVETGQTGEHFRSGLIARISRRVALHADGLRTRAKFCVRWMADPVVAVADDASGKASGLKGGFVRAFLVHLVLEDVAFRTDVLNRIHARRSRAMVSVAGGTRWRAEVTADDQCVMVHAGAVLARTGPSGSNILSCTRRPHGSASRSEQH